MKHRINKRIETMVEELHVLRECVETLLDVASSDARVEWRNLLPRVPAIADLDSGFIALSETELEQMTAKIFRFAAILRANSTRASAPPQAPARSARRPS